MTEHAKNMMVGLTMIGAMLLLGWMIILFTGLPNLLKSGYEVHIRMEARSELNVGDKIHLEGMEVGSVSSIAFTDPKDPYKGITVTALVDPEIILPSNTVLWVTKRTLGRPWLEFFAQGDLPPGKAETLSKSEPDTISGYAKEASLLPDELGPALKGLAELSENLNKLLAPEDEPGSATSPATTAPKSIGARSKKKGLAGTLENLNTTLAGLAEVFGDIENKNNLKATLANLAAASEKADKAMGAIKEFADETRKSFTQAASSAGAVGKRIDKLAQKLIEDAEKISTVLATINRIAMKVEKGEGTAGKILNDAKLYNNLQEAARQTQILLKEFSELVKTWKESGVKIKM
ncbi:MAG: MCE family protein [Phycisphaerales bacterium]|jgi:phospholipid/cholesterol/gamma-HCH transport system substrate-binding protein|nr:MCE family protein [Phycisphaerales bacterium]